MPPKPFTGKVTAVRDLTPTVFEIDFTADPSFEFLAGQFISIVVPGASAAGKDIRRAYSIASGPKDSVIQLCVKLVDGGPGTNYLKKLRVGDTFRAFAPYGDFLCETAKDRHVVFISTGTGIAPFRSMMRDPAFWDGRTGRVFNLFGARSADEILYEKEITYAGRAQFLVALSRPASGWSGFHGRVTDFLRQGKLDLSTSELAEKAEVYLCGSSAMIEEIKSILLSLGMPKTSIHQEIYYKVKPEESGS